ncbi:MAG: DUF5686 family protein [Bacteroidota bacterium]|nr:DUF5686 family protein [Bacteroidota bacterium]
MHPTVKRCLLFLIFFSVHCYAQTCKLEGIVYDKTSRQPLPYATIQMKGAALGTTTNNQGRFTLDLTQNQQTIVISFIGYKSQEISLKLPLKYRLEVFLEPLSILLPEILIGSNDEDPAYRIVRNAIKNKETNSKSTDCLKYDEYRKAIFKSAGKIASVEEYFMKSFVKGNDEKTLTLASFKTENIKKDNNNINAFKGLRIDFYKDTVTLFMNKVHMPLAKDAFDFYKFKLLNTRSTESKMVYFIEVIPRSEIRPLFKGMILIEDSTFALAGLELRNNGGITVPFITDLNLKFTERKIKSGNLWFPQFLESYLSLGVSLGGLLSVEKMELEQLRSFSNQKIDPAGLDSSIALPEKNPFRNLGIIDTFSTSKKSRENPYKPVLLSQTTTDSLRPIPLNDKEMTAYRQLDSTKKPLTMIKTKGVLSGFVDTQVNKNSESSFLSKAADKLFDYLRFKNNRIEGIGLGAGYEGSYDTTFHYGVSGVYSFKPKKPEGKVNLGYKFHGKDAPFISLEGFSLLRRWNESSQFSDIMNSISVTLGLEDNFNYLRSQGFSLSVKKSWKDTLSVLLGFLSEKQSSEARISKDSFINHRIIKSTFAQRINPEIKEGFDNRIMLKFFSGSDPFDYQFMPQSGLMLNADVSLKQLGGDFSYLKVHSVWQMRFNTFFRELFFPPYMILRIEGEMIKGNYGIQHIITPDNALTVLAPFGVFKGIKPYEYAGDKMGALYLEHNWRGIIFQKIGLRSLSEMNYGISTGGSMLKVWNSSEMTKLSSEKMPLYWEVYTGVTGIFGLLRLDAVYTSKKTFVARGGFTLSL